MKDARRLKKKTRAASPLKRVLGGVGYASFLTLACGTGVVANWANRSSIINSIIKNPFALLNADPKKTFHKDDGLTLLILGTDDERVPVGWGVDERGKTHMISKVTRRGARADMILVARLDFEHNRITGLSIPRDTAFRMRSFDRDTHRINAFYSLAPKGGEKDAMVKAVEYVLPGVQVDRTIALNYDAFQELVDTVGGVSVTVPKGPDGKGLQYDDDSGDLHIHLSPGPKTLNGKDAMGYVRFRHDRESDFGRQERQKEFLTSFKSSVLHDLPQLPEIAEQSKMVLDNALTDNEIIALIAFARKVPQTSIKLGMLPTYPSGKVLRVVEGKRESAMRQYGLLPQDGRTAEATR